MSTRSRNSRCQGPDGFDDLLVANYGDGLVTLLAGGPDGLTPEEDGAPGLDHPTSLAYPFFVGDDLEAYAATEGSETPVLLMLTLGGTSGTGSPATSLTLLPLSELSLPLVATPLITGTNSALDESIGSNQGRRAGSSRRWRCRRPLA